MPGAVLHHVEIESVDPKAIRNRLKITQTRMAALLGVSVSGYRKWEQKSLSQRTQFRLKHLALTHCFEVYY